MFKPTNCICSRIFLLLAALACFSFNMQGQNGHDSLRLVKGVFDFPEITVSPSPSTARSIQLKGIEKVVDSDVSPASPLVALLVKDAGNTYAVRFWKIGDETLSDCWTFPQGIVPASVVWHPLGEAIFVTVARNSGHEILRIEKKGDVWSSKTIFSSANPLKRLVVCPRPFVTEHQFDPWVELYSYRLFFGMKTDKGSFRTVSVTEDGKRFYQVIGPASSMTPADSSGVPPSEMVAGFALPLSFHPAGHEMIWENEKREFQVARYNTSFWGNSKPLSAKELIGGSITATPNGLGFIHWQKEKPGIGLWFIATGKEERQLADYTFIATPSSVPDGRGIVGLMKQNDQLQLSYFPINMPLADVQNAWMYAESVEETNLLEKNYGLFRTTNQDQLYELYETENYACGDYDRTAPTRPYLVTTDIFWELFASAYEGLFIIAERDKAIPNFWKFIGLADQHYRQSSDSSAWKSVFRALTDLHSGKKENPEVIRILNSAGELWSDDLHDKFDYAELKPRSHYASSEAMQLYFRAFKYFTMVYENNARALEELNQLPSEIQSFALNWIEAYLGFIAPSRSPSVWKKLNATPPSYNENPGSKVTIFPLSWGFDNEVLYSTVYHMNLPPERTIIGPGGERLTPSGLDLAAALGNGLAGILLKPEFEKYPPLKNMVAKLAQNFSKNAKVPKNGANLYDRWITALAIQWADTTASANNNLDKLLWQTKRLQTGLASWATLRHATGLVNERTVAECGEAGFEPIILRAPRGYVEPDPRTFAAIADLFETAIKYIPGEASGAPDLHESYEEAKGSLHEGIHRRLTEIAKDTRTFRDIAEKELAGRELSPEEYEKILYVGTIAEHYFLIFKSLSNPEYALSTPEPMAKIADVAGSRDFSFLNAAVGAPLEWDYVVPFYGRHEIVKGSVYSYYEFNSNELLNDQEWRNRLKTQKHLPWTKPLITEKAVSYPAASGY